MRNAFLAQLPLAVYLSPMEVWHLTKLARFTQRLAVHKILTERYIFPSSAFITCSAETKVIVCICNMVEAIAHFILRSKVTFFSCPSATPVARAGAARLTYARGVIAPACCNTIASWFSAVGALSVNRFSFARIIPPITTHRRHLL
jgi:hypothetical protein